MSVNPGRSRISWFIVPGLGLFFAVFFATLNQLRISILDPPAGTLPHFSMLPTRQVYVQTFSRWLTYAALSPAVGWLVSVRPLRWKTIPRDLPLYLGAAIVFAALHNAAVGVLFEVFLPVPDSTLQKTMAQQMLVYFPLDFVIFWAVSGAYHAVRYHRETVHREQLAAALQASLAEARLDALRAQLSPHFLFNTLHSVSALALTDERERIVQTLSDISDLLRVSLDPDLPQEIPLSRELEILDRYLQIQRTRFGDRLTVVKDISSVARNALLPSMMLQPLVENALQHGIGRRPGAGRVSLSAEQDGTRLRIRVEDTGPGFGGVSASRDGIGLTNTRARLEQLYGDRQQLECGDLQGGGAFVEVRLPFRVSEAEGESR